MSRQTKKREAAGVVYFIREKGTGCIKIGKTTDVRGRIKGLQTGSPQGLQLLAVVPGYTEVEERLHRRFAADRVSGEWFRPSSEILAFIDGVVAAGHASDLVVAAAEVAGLRAQVMALQDDLSWHRQAEILLGESHKELVQTALRLELADRDGEDSARLAHLDDELDRLAGDAPPPTERRPGAEVGANGPLCEFGMQVLERKLKVEALHRARKRMEASENG